MAIDNKLPFYFKDTNPGANNTALTSRLYQWDETSNAPVEVLDGKAKMSPRTESTEWILWTDTTTLGYADRLEAPIYFSDGGQGNAKRLQIINHVKYKMGLAMEDNLSSAITWAQNEDKVYISTNVTIVNTDSETEISNDPVVIPAGFENYTGHYWTKDGGANFLTDAYALLKLDVGPDTQQFHNGLRRGYIGTEDGAAMFDYWTKDWQYTPSSTSISPIFQGTRGNETFDLKGIFNYDYSTVDNPRTWTTWGGGTGGYSNPAAFTNLGGEAGGELGRVFTLTMGLTNRQGNALLQGSTNYNPSASDLYPGMVVKMDIPAFNNVKYFLLTSVSIDNIDAAYGGGPNYDQAYTIARLGLIAISNLAGTTTPISVRTGYNMNISFMRNLQIEGSSAADLNAYVVNYFLP